MSVREIKGGERQESVFKCVAREVVPICDVMRRVLLQDSCGEFVYAMMEGNHWTQKANVIKEGDKILLGPFIAREIPQKYLEFYAPRIPGKKLPPFYISFKPSDSDVRFEVETEKPKKRRSNFRNLKECEGLALSKSISRVSVAGVIIDFVIEEKKKCDNICKMKIVDSSLETGKFLTLNCFVSGENPPSVVSIGDIVVAHGVKWEVFKSNVQGTYSRSLGGLGIFHWKNAELVSSVAPFSKDEEVLEKVHEANNWELNKLETQDLTTGKTLENIGQAKHSRYQALDIIAYVAKKEEKFPEAFKTTLVLCDDTGFLYYVGYYYELQHIQEKTWIKFREAKIFSNYLERTQHSSILPMPEWSLNVKNHLRETLPGIEHMKTEALSSFGQFYQDVTSQQELIVTEPLMKDTPLFEEAQVLNPFEQKEFCRLKAIFIEIQPRNLESAFIEKEGRLEFCGVMKLWSMHEIIEVILSGKDAALLFGLQGSKQEMLQQVKQGIARMSRASNWVVLGLRRVIKENRVLLKLVQTIINQ